MRTLVIASGLAGLYALCEPYGQPAGFNLIAYALCVVVAFAIGTTGDSKSQSVAILFASLVLYAMLLGGVGMLFFGIYQYTMPHTDMFGTPLVTNIWQPLISCLCGVATASSSGYLLYLFRK